MGLSILVSLALIFCSAVMAEPPSNWPQFRGPNSGGLAGEQSPPVEFGPEAKLLWRTEVRTGHSSPAVWGDRIFLTAFDADEKELLALAVDRQTGKILWRRTVESEAVEKVHQVSNPAASTPAVDADFVYVYFGSHGLVAFDHDGQQQWDYRLPVARVAQGSGVSPVVAGERVILNREGNDFRFLTALDRRSGKELWKVDHLPAPQPHLRSNWSTPIVRDGRIFLHHGGEVAAFDIEDGSRIWWFGIATTGTSTPVLTDDAIYVGGFTPVGEEDHRVELPSFEELIERADADGNGSISKDEFPEDVLLFKRPEIEDIGGSSLAIKNFFGPFDPNKDGEISAAEWAGTREWAATNTKDHGLVKVTLGGDGDVTETRLVWQEKKSVPEAPSPLVVGNRAYMIKNGGIITCLDAETGARKFRARLGAPGAYYSSPVAVNDRVYVASSEGIVVVFKDSDTLEVLARNEIGEPIFATPAFVDDTIYLRTESALCAFSD